MKNVQILSALLLLSGASQSFASEGQNIIGQMKRMLENEASQVEVEKRYLSIADSLIESKCSQEKKAAECEVWKSLRDNHFAVMQAMENLLVAKKASQESIEKNIDTHVNFLSQLCKHAEETQVVSLLVHVVPDSPKALVEAQEEKDSSKNLDPAHSTSGDLA